MLFIFVGSARIPQSFNIFAFAEPFSRRLLICHSLRCTESFLCYTLVWSFSVKTVSVCYSFIFIHIFSICSVSSYISYIFMGRKLENKKCAGDFLPCHFIALPHFSFSVSFISIFLSLSLFILFLIGSLLLYLIRLMWNKCMEHNEMLATIANKMAW